MIVRFRSPWPAHMLNRLNMEEVANAGVIHPLDALYEIHQYAATDDLLELFDHFCIAANADRYSWKEGAPANCLFFAEQLELLIECCYLIHRQYPHCPRVPDLRGFFVHRGLLEWKHALHGWLEAALGNGSIQDEFDPEEQAVFIYHVRRLINTAHIIPILPIENTEDAEDSLVAET